MPLSNLPTFFLTILACIDLDFDDKMAAVYESMMHRTACFLAVSVFPFCAGNCLRVHGIRTHTYMYFAHQRSYRCHLPFAQSCATQTPPGVRRRTHLLVDVSDLGQLLTHRLTRSADATGANPSSTLLLRSVILSKTFPPGIPNKNSTSSSKHKSPLAPQMAQGLATRKKTKASVTSTPSWTLKS